MNQTRGYSLLEMIVSVGLFSVVMLVATAAYLTLISMDRQTRATSDLMTNMSFAVDSMSRAIRTGTDYCIAGCFQDQFSFVDSENRVITYQLENGAITRKIGGAASQAITDPRITVGEGGLRFYVWGQTLGASDGQPRVTFSVTGSVVAEPGADPIEFVVQGGATQRAIDI